MASLKFVCYNIVLIRSKTSHQMVLQNLLLLLFFQIDLIFLFYEYISLFDLVNQNLLLNLPVEYLYLFQVNL